MSSKTTFQDFERLSHDRRLKEIKLRKNHFIDSAKKIILLKPNTYCIFNLYLVDGYHKYLGNKLLDEKLTYITRKSYEVVFL